MFFINRNVTIKGATNSSPYQLIIWYTLITIHGGVQWLDILHLPFDVEVC